MVKPTVKIAVMDQLPQGGVPARSSLYRQAAQATPSHETTYGVYLWEEGLHSHLILRGNADEQAFGDGVHKATGLRLPTTLRSVAGDEWSMGWLAPDEWLLTGPGEQAFEMETKLRGSLSGHYSVVNVSGGLTLLRMSGPEAVSVLMKSCPYDVHERNFPTGKIVATVFAKSQATLRHLSADQWELVVRRSFADYIWRWLLKAASEYSVHIGTPSESGATVS